jgi:hypothetical protein
MSAAFNPIEVGMRRSAKWGSVVLLVFALPFAGIGVWTGSRLAATVTAYHAAQQWEETPARIILVEFKHEDTGEGITSWVKCLYEYDYQGRQYQGKRVSLHRGSDNIGSFWDDVFRELKECRRNGRPFRCYVNPANPAQAVLYRDLRWEMVVFQALFTFVFAGAGFGLLIAAPVVFFQGHRDETLVAAHPHEPWLRRADWAKGEIKFSASSRALLAVAGTLAFLLFAVPVELLLLRELINKQNWGGLTWVVFLTLGETIVAWPIILVRRWHKYGPSVFQMASVPGVIGGELRGVIRTSVKIRPAGGFRVTLTCRRTVRTNGDGNKEACWQLEQVIVHEVPENDPERSAIPVLFQVPFECLPTDFEAGTHWQLEVKAAMPGVDYRAVFDVPLFKTPQSDPSFVPDDKAIAPYAAPPDPDRDLHDAGVRKMASPTGEGSRFEFSVARSLGYSGMVLVSTFWIVCTGTLVFMLYMKASLHPTIVLVAFDALLLVLLLKVWFHRSVLDVSPLGLAVVSGPFGLGHRRWFCASEIDRIEPEFPSHALYSGLVLVCRGGTRLTIAKRIPSQRLALAVIRQIEKAMGRPPFPGEETSHVRKLTLD